MFLDIFQVAIWIFRRTRKIQLNLWLIFSAPSRKVETNYTHTHTSRIEGNVIFSPEGMKSNFILTYPQSGAYKKKKKSCYSQHISPSLVGHFHVFVFRVLRVIVSRELLENSSFPYSTFLHFPISRSVDKHWDRDIIYEYSFWQAKKFPH